MTTETIEKNATVSNLETVEINEVDIVQALTVLPEQKTALDVFKNEGGEAEIILNRVKEHFSSLVFDMGTAKGRAECRSQAALIRKIKVRMEEYGKAEADELKRLPKMIDNTRKLFKTELDILAEEVRAPLTAYEAEEERKKAEEKAKAEAEELARQEEIAKKEAELKAKEEELEKQKQALLEAEQEKEREAKLKEQAAADAKREAELEILKAKNAEADALRAKEQAEKEKVEALAKAEEEKQAEIARINAENEAKEKARLEQEEVDRKAEEARKANVEHQRTINRAIIATLEELGLDCEMATVLLKAMVKGGIPNVTVNY